MSNKINVDNATKELCKVFKAGYGDTIELKINGEHYKVTSSSKCKSKK